MQTEMERALIRAFALRYWDDRWPEWHWDYYVREYHKQYGSSWSTAQTQKSA